MESLQGGATLQHSSLMQAFEKSVLPWHRTLGCTQLARWMCLHPPCWRRRSESKAQRFFTMLQRSLLGSCGAFGQEGALTRNVRHFELSPDPLGGSHQLKAPRRQRCPLHFGGVPAYLNPDPRGADLGCVSQHSKPSPESLDPDPCRG